MNVGTHFDITGSRRRYDMFSQRPGTVSSASSFANKLSATQQYRQTYIQGDSLTLTKTYAADNSRAILMQTAKAGQTELPDFSKMSDREKLAALAKLHNSTDYSGMTDVEKYKLINDRFEAAFPHFNSYTGGLFGPVIVCFENPADGANHVKTLPERIYDESHRQLSSLGITNAPKLHREAYYSGMSDEEVIAAINQRHSGGTMIDRYDALYEMFEMGVSDKRAIGNAMEAMERTTRKVVTGTIYGTSLYSDGQFRMAYGYASGTKVSWAQVKEMVRACAAELGAWLSEGYGKTVEEAIDELFDDLLNAETTKVS